MLVMSPKESSKANSNDKRLVVYISEEMFESLQKLAEKEDRSISNYTRNLLSKVLENENREEKK